MSRYRVLRRAVHFALILGIVALAVKYVDFGAIGLLLIGTSPVTVAVLIGLCVVDRSLMAVKWQHLLRVAGVAVPFRTIWATYFRASFVTPLIPTSLGGDVLRIYVIGKHSRRRDLVTVSVLLEKVTAILAGVILATLGSLALYDHLAARDILYLVPLMPTIGVTLALLFLASFSPRLWMLLRRALPWETARRLASKLERAYAAYRGRSGALIANTGLACLEQGLQILVLYLAARSVGVDAPALSLMAVFGVSQFLRKVAIVLEGWGFAEFMVVISCKLVGIEIEQALAFSLLANGLNWIAASPGLYFLMVWKDTRTEPEDGERASPAGTPATAPTAKS